MSLYSASIYFIYIYVDLLDACIQNSMNLNRWKYHICQVSTYIRKTHNDEEQPPDVNKGICPLVRDRNMQLVEIHNREKSLDILHDHPIVHEWINRLMCMNRDLSALFEVEGGGFFHRMGINNASGVEKWGAACTMGQSVEFHDDVTSLLQRNITLYVRKRMSYVLECLNEIRGPARQYVQYTYVEPWDTLMGPDDVF
jgi:hypothetical protein